MVEAKQLIQLIANSNKSIVFTGAGISTESGISDFRSKGGLWDRYQPVTIQEFLADEEKRREYWKRKKETFADIRKAKPSRAHLLLAELEKQGRLLGIITQNIDGLHSLAGNSKVLEIHGTNREVVCLSCGKVEDFELAYRRLCDGEEILICHDCGGFLKPNTISFGQNLNTDVLRDSMAWCRRADLMLVLGSTLIVEPAASLPVMAKQHGAYLVIINRDSTPIDGMADLVFHEEITPLLSDTLKEGC